MREIFRKRFQISLMREWIKKWVLIRLFLVLLLESYMYIPGFIVYFVFLHLANRTWPFLVTICNLSLFLSRMHRSGECACDRVAGLYNFLIHYWIGSLQRDRSLFYIFSIFCGFLGALIYSFVAREVRVSKYPLQME